MSTQAAIEPHRVERQLRLGGLLALRLGDRNSRFDFGDLLADILLGTGEDCGSRSAVVRVTPIATRPHLEIGGLGCELTSQKTRVLAVAVARLAILAMWQSIQLTPAVAIVLPAYIAWLGRWQEL